MFVNFSHLYTAVMSLCCTYVLGALILSVFHVLNPPSPFAIASAVLLTFFCFRYGSFYCNRLNQIQYLVCDRLNKNASAYVSILLYPLKGVAAWNLTNSAGFLLKYSGEQS